MSVQSEIDRIITAVGNAYRKVSEKGGTVPASQTVSNLATAIDSIPSGGGAEPATLTITSQSYNGDRYGMFIFVNSEGHLERFDYNSSPFTFPITVETVLGGTVIFIPSGFLGIPLVRNPIGCETDKYFSEFYILVTSSQASVEIYLYD